MNKSIFNKRSTPAPVATTRNEAGGVAYTRGGKEVLAQFVATGTFNSTFYVNEKDHLQRCLMLAAKVDPYFLAQAAVYGRRECFMKDVPVFLLAALCILDPYLFERVFPLVIDNGKMLRNFVKIVRSGVLGRKSLGSRPKRLIRNWFDGRDDEKVFRNSIGNDPRMADIVKMVHPRPTTPGREALYGWLLDKPINRRHLPAVIKRYEALKSGKAQDTEGVPFEMLTSLDLSEEGWRVLATQATWQQTRMNLNTFSRHGVFNNSRMVDMIAERLADPQLVARSKVFPYQLLMAYTAAGDNVPAKVRQALHTALEHATRNVPEISGQVYVCPDVSGSMHDPVTGSIRGATSKVRCVDVAALFAATIARVNPSTEIIPFSSQLYLKLGLDPSDTIMTNAKKLASLPPGGTMCSLPLRELNRRKAKGDLIVLISDNESWIETAEHHALYHSQYYAQHSGGTGLMSEWQTFKSRNPRAKLVSIDITPNVTSQVKQKDRPDILEVGGFSDQVFKVVSSFTHGGTSHWVEVIGATEI